MATPTTAVKNNSKYNNCTLECIGLSTCMELLLKLEREKTFFRVLGLQGRNNKNVLSICLASWKNIPLFFAFKIQGVQHRTLMTRPKKKSANHNCVFSELSPLAFLSSLLKVIQCWSNLIAT